MKIYVKKSNEKYQVIKEGAKRASKTFTSYIEAKEYAKTLAEKENGEVVDNIVAEKVTSTIKSNKGLRRFLIVLFIIILIAAIVLGYLNKDKIIAALNKPSEPSSSESKKPAVIGDANFQIHFLELGNEYAGDCTYIKAGENDILIDAGSRKGSATTIKQYVDQYCTDGKLEYVIATHAHQDHIAGFVGTVSGNSRTGIYYQYEIGTIIDFSKTDTTTQLYDDYKEAREYAISKGTTWHTADYYFTNESDYNLKKSTGSIDLEEGLKFDILWNKYYFESSSDENDYSVCTLFTHGENKFLLTGDLEHEGEEALANYYKTNGGLGHVKLFKAGHHGSKTSSNDCLLDLITPEVCCVCCCAGSTEYTADYNNIFPTQDFITRIAKHTDEVYVTSLFNEETKEFESMNGNIVVSSDSYKITTVGSNNTTKLKDTAWFNQTIYVDKNNLICSGKGKTDFFTSKTTGATAKVRRVWPS